jgi:hypothetical protein
MKLITIFLALTFSVMFSSSLYADWTKVDENASGDVFYVDFETIRKHDGYVYFEQLTDMVRPLLGFMSWKFHKQGDCKLFRFKRLSASFHTEQMGGGTGVIPEPKGKDIKWNYPYPNSIEEIQLKSVCNRFSVFSWISSMFSSSSYAGWTEVVKDGKGNTFYVDFERMRKVDGYVYWWGLRDLSKPFKGVLSTEEYRQSDCKLFRNKTLTRSNHKEPMGGGTFTIDNNPDKEWTYAPPNSSFEIALKSVCNQ